MRLDGRESAFCDVALGRRDNGALIVLPDGHLEVPLGKIAAVVTLLEMIDRPQLHSGPTNNCWKIQRVVAQTSSGTAIFSGAPIH